MTAADLGLTIGLMSGVLLLVYGAAPLVRAERASIQKMKLISENGLLALAVLILSALSGIFLKGSFAHLLLVICGCLFILPALLLAGVFLGWRAFAPICCALAATLLMSWIVGNSIHRWEISSVRGYVQKMVPLLDEIKSREGTYPPTVPTAKWGFAPKLLSYQSDGASFRFEYWDPAGMMDGYEFTSEVRSWTYFD